MSFKGPGVYALFYDGDFEPYRTLRSTDSKRPIYVGKAVLAGARKGGLQDLSNPGPVLSQRIKEHCRSISAVSNLKLEHFTCRYLVVVPLWVNMAERFLIDYYRPAWNVCIEGFGLHDPGGGRRKGEASWWDVLHPGRPWVALQQSSRSHEAALERLKSYVQSGGQGWQPSQEETSEESA